MLPKTLRALFEIRLRWSDEVVQEQPARCDGLWLPDLPRNRILLNEAMALGNRLYGDETHWIEQRQA